MSQSNRRLAAVAASLTGLVAAGVLAAGSTAPAGADYAPTAKDVVGVGSDIIQNSMNFLADGVILGTTPFTGYNTAGNVNKLISFDSTADTNGRNAFVDPNLAATRIPLNPTINLRAGASPVQRPNGGGAGLAALVADGVAGDATKGGLIDFARTPNLPTSAQQATASSTLGSQLHSVQIAVDKQYIASATTTNAPATLTPAQLVQIYTCAVTTWGALPGYTGPGGAQTIKPLIPQNGAGVRTVFLNALKAANGGNAVTPGSCTTEVQQNDPTTITSLPDEIRPNAIVPFPIGRFNLLNKGYFRDPNTVYSAGKDAEPLTTAGIKLQQGAGGYAADIPYFVVFREKDATSSTPWQPGSDLNWVQTLFYNPDYDANDPDPAGPPAPWVQSEAGKAILTELGLTATYVDRTNQTAG